MAGVGRIARAMARGPILPPGRNAGRGLVPWQTRGPGAGAGMQAQYRASRCVRSMGPGRRAWRQRRRVLSGRKTKDHGYGGTLPACRAVHCRCMARGYRTGPCADVGPARTGAISPNGMVPCPTAYRRADRWADRWAEAGLWVQVSEIQSERPRAGYRSSTARSAAPTRRPRLEMASGSRPRSFSWRIAPVAPAASRRRVRSVAGKGGVVSPCFPP